MLCLLSHAQSKSTMVRLEAPVNREVGDATARQSGSKVPRWVKAFGITALGLMLLVAVLHLRGHGMHHMGHG